MGDPQGPQGVTGLHEADVTAHEAALLRHPELVEQIEADRADPTRAVRSKARRPR